MPNNLYAVFVRKIFSRIFLGGDPLTVVCYAYELGYLLANQYSPGNSLDLRGPTSKAREGRGKGKGEWGRGNGGMGKERGVHHGCWRMDAAIVVPPPLHQILVMPLF